MTINVKKISDSPSAIHLLFDALEDDLKEPYDSNNIQTLNDETFTISNPTLGNNHAKEPHGYKSKIINLLLTKPWTYTYTYSHANAHTSL